MKSMFNYITLLASLIKSSSATHVGTFIYNSWLPSLTTINWLMMTSCINFEYHYIKELKLQIS